MYKMKKKKSYREREQTHFLSLPIVMTSITILNFYNNSTYLLSRHYNFFFLTKNLGFAKLNFPSITELTPVIPTTTGL